MNLLKLDSSLRDNLRNLLQGYVEHCEISDTLMARIETPLYYHGFKFGSPVFTHRQLGVSGDDPPVGILGLNQGTNTLPSEVVLQIIEKLVQRTDAAGSSPLRMLPVANPVALELGADAPSHLDWPLLDHLIEEFEASSPAGFIAIAPSPAGEFRLGGSISPEAIRKLVTHQDHLKMLGEFHLIPVEAGGAWSLRLEIPERLTSTEVLHTANLVLSILNHQ